MGRVGIVTAAAAGAVLSSCGGRVELTCGAPVAQEPDAGIDSADHFCGDPAIQADVYAPGMTKVGAGGALSFELVESRPAPPQRGSNVFVVQVRDASGPVLVDLSLISHIGRTRNSVPAIVTLDAATLTYTINPVYLFMVGVWKIELDARKPGADGGPPIDMAMFSFCVDG